MPIADSLFMKSYGILQIKDKKSECFTKVEYSLLDICRYLIGNAAEMINTQERTSFYNKVKILYRKSVQKITSA